MSVVSDVGSSKVGQQQGLVKCILTLILQVPKYVTNDQRFELLVLVSILMNGLSSLYN